MTWPARFSRFYRDSSVTLTPVLISREDMEYTTQLVFILSLALTHGHLLSLGRELPHHGPGHPEPPDIFDPLLLLPRSLEMFDTLGPFGRHQFGHPGMHGSFDPPNGQVSNADNVKATTDIPPLKVTFLPKADNRDNTVQRIVSGTKKKEQEIPERSNNTLTPQLGVDEPVLRTNENKTAPKPVDKKKLRTNNTVNVPQKLRTENKIQAGDAIVFPDDIDEVKQAHKGNCDNLNKTSNKDDNNKLNYNKNSDNIVFPGYNVQVPTETRTGQTVNPMQNTNENSLSGSGSPSEMPSQNYVYQAVPVTNDVFPNRPALYTTANTGQGSLYTNVINTFPQNGQPFNAALNTNNNIYYQTPSSVSAPIPWSGNNLNQNVDIVNNVPSGNFVNSVNIETVQNPQDTLAIPTLLVNPNTVGNNQQYNGQQHILQPVNNVQSNLVQQGQTVPLGIIPYNTGNVLTQANYLTPNNNGNIGQQFVLRNVGQTYVPNNNQPKVNGQQLYMISNSNHLNNNVNNDQPVLSNPQRTIVTFDTNNVLTDNTQKFMLVNVNPQNIAQNGQTNSLPLQNGQIVALVPYQGTNRGVDNRVNDQTQVLNSNIVQPIQNAGNPATTNSYTNQPSILVNNVPNNSVFLNSNGQNSLVNIGQTLYKLVPVNRNIGNDQIPGSNVNLISMNDKEDRLNATAGNNP